jgi:DNA primase
MRIPDEILATIRASLDIVEVIGEYVPLKQRGSNYFGLCPFHQEKTPSFSVNPRLGIFKCFGCGAGGDVFTFIQQIEGVSFLEAVHLLAERAGIPLPNREDAGENEREPLFQALRFAARFYFTQLTQEASGKLARAYLKSRSIHPAAVRRFGLGYAPKAWDALATAASASGFHLEVFEQAGLLLPRRERGRFYDRFRHRLMFPIFSHVGKVVGFAGRLLEPEAKQPKYINSPETPVYQKGRILYGLYQARHAIRKREEAILVEGYTDVIALHQAGLEHAVASSGTALTAEQVRLLARYARRVVLLYDADPAGEQATLRSIDLFLEQGLPVYVVTLPAGEDPDSFVRQYGGEAFQEYLERHRQDFITFRYRLSRRLGLLDTPEGEAQLAREMVQSIARFPDSLLRETYLRRASEVLRIPEVRLFELLRTLPLANLPPPQPPRVAAEIPPLPKPTQLESLLPPEKLLLRLMLQEGRSMVAFVLGHMALAEFTEGPPRQLVAHLLEKYEAGEPIDARPFLEGRYGPELQHVATDVMMDPYEPSKGWARRGIPIPHPSEQAFKIAADAIVRLKLQRIDRLIHQLQQEQLQSQHDEARLREIMQQLISLQRLRNEISHRAFLNPDLLP